MNKIHTIKDISDLNVLYRSFLKCKRDVQWKESVQRFEFNLLRNLTQIHIGLGNGSYKADKCLEFDINERGKTRHIRANTIRDRVVYGALNDNVILPSIEKYLIYDNGASQKGKGVTFTENRLKEHLRRYYRHHGADGYILQMDFAKYFDNVDHKQAKDLLFKYVNCDNNLKVFIESIIDSFGDKSVAIGNPISQSIGILYAHPVDTYCKTVKGCKYYGRYMDDIYIIHSSKDFLKDLYSRLKEVCVKNKLNIHAQKTHIVKLSHGFTFLKKKYTISRSGKITVTLKRKAIQREKCKLLKLKRFMCIEEIANNYKAWRQSLINRYDCYKKIQHIDNFYRRNIYEI